MNDLSEGKDWAGLSQADAEMLSYARNLTVDASSIDEGDIARLRELGFSDRAILEINLAAAYMNFVNRIAEGQAWNWKRPFEALHADCNFLAQLLLLEAPRSPP